MPIYDYLCNECGSHYDIFHKVREIKEDVVCPSCQSQNSRKLISVPGVVHSHTRPQAEPCRAESFGGACCGGMCSTN